MMARRDATQRRVFLTQSTDQTTARELAVAWGTGTYHGEGFGSAALFGVVPSSFRDSAPSF